MKLLSPTLVILAQVTALADGGAVQMRKEVGELVITVFTSPSPLAVGPVDISVLLQNRKGLEPVLDANVFVFLREKASDAEFQAHPTREQAKNKLLYAAPVTFSKQGKWEITITVGRNGKETGAAGILEVAPAPGRAFSYAGYIAFPPVMIGLFVVRERLVRRRSQRGA
jgi:hypothetical protein